MFKQLEKLCLAETSSLIKDNEYIYIDNGADILGVAHCDTVFDGREKENFYHENEYYIFSPKLDDRTGVFTLLYFLPKFYPNIRFDILLTTNEERGSSTAKFFKAEKQYNWCFEFDRQGTGAVLYDYEYSEKWTKAVYRNFKLHQGSYSDISDLNSLECCCLNIGTGYHNQHTICCFLDKAEYLKQLKRFCDFYYKNRNKHYKFNNELNVLNWYEEQQEWDDYNNLYGFTEEDSLFFDDYRILNSEL